MFIQLLVLMYSDVDYELWRVSSCVPATDYATDGSHSHQHDSHHVTDRSHWYVQCDSLRSVKWYHTRTLCDIVQYDESTRVNLCIPIYV